MKHLMISFMFLAAVALGAEKEKITGVSEGKSSEGGGDQIECANLIYAGTKKSVCFSEKFLSAVGQHTTIQSVRKFKLVKLSSEELFRYPFVDAY